MNIIITGASRGIGKAIAEVFAANGHSLYLCSKNEAALYKTVEELLNKYPGTKIKAKARDLRKKEEVENFGQWLLDNSMTIDVLVNNAGNFLPGSVHSEEAGMLEDMMAVNLYSAYHLTRKDIANDDETKSCVRFKRAYLQYVFNCIVRCLSERRVVQHQQICTEWFQSEFT
jgi:short-subunit dehydrogenase